jgi:hypothetical protein
MVRASAVRTQISQEQSRSSAFDLGCFRRPVVRSEGAIHRPEALPRRTRFPVGRGSGRVLPRLGVPDMVIQRILSHANVSTTATYYIKTAAADVHRAMAKRNWNK